MDTERRLTADERQTADTGILYATATLMVSPHTGKLYYDTQVKQAYPLWGRLPPTNEEADNG